MTYDQWKCTDPREYEREECGHDDYEVDTLEGRCHCSCGVSWHASEADIQAAIDSEIAYARHVEEMESRWYRFRKWVCGLRFSFGLRRRSRVTAGDDDIPF